MQPGNVALNSLGEIKWSVCDCGRSTQVIEDLLPLLSLPIPPPPHLLRLKLPFFLESMLTPCFSPLPHCPQSTGTLYRRKEKWMPWQPWRINLIEIDGGGPRKSYSIILAVRKVIRAWWSHTLLLKYFATEEFRCLLGLEGNQKRYCKGN